MSTCPIRFLLSCILIVSSLLLHSQAITDKKRGRTVIHNQDGSVSVGHSKNYLRHGKWYTSYPNHQRKSFGRYVHGTASGRHEGFWPDGKPQWIVNYKNGIRDGVFITYDSKGFITEQSYYLNGILHGPYYKLDSTDNSWVRGEYLDGLKTNVWTTSIHDSLAVCMYVLDKKNGMTFTTLPNGHRISGYYKNDIRDSVWRETVSGKLSREYWFTLGKPCKTTKVFSPDDSALVLSETKYEAPGIVLHYLQRYPNGNIEKAEWYSNQHLDSITDYFMNGEVKCRYIYRQRELGFRQVVHEYHGYDSTGMKIYVHYNDRNGFDSIHRNYASSGIVLRELEYVKGSMSGEKYFYPSGKPMLNFSNETMNAFSETGKQFAPGTSAYITVFKKLDSLQSATPVFLCFPPLVIGYTVPLELQAFDFEKTVTYVDQSPEFPGGSDSMKLYLKKHIKYPEIDKELGNEGTVFVQFVVEKNGMITNVKVLKGVKGAEGLDAEAVRVVSGMPNWSPGYLQGIPVRYQMTLPVRFQMN